MESPQRLLTEREAASILQLPVSRVKRMAKDRVLPSVVLPDGAIRFEMSELFAWIRSRRQTALACEVDK